MSQAQRRVVSVNVGLPRHVSWQGRELWTGIFKEPVTGAVQIRRHQMAGDGQADLSVHGGPWKAVYAYPEEHYAFWAEELAESDLAWGHFGENLTLEGLREDDVRIGDRFRMGSAELVVTQPRTPCVKLAARFGRADMVKRFEQSGRSGFYLAVAEEGELEAGAPVERLASDASSMTVAEVLRLARTRQPDPALLHRALELPALSPEWRESFRKRLTRLA